MAQHCYKPTNCQGSTILNSMWQHVHQTGLVHQRNTHRSRYGASCRLLMCCTSCWHLPACGIAMAPILAGRLVSLRCNARCLLQRACEHVRVALLGIDSARVQAMWSGTSGWHLSCCRTQRTTPSSPLCANGCRPRFRCVAPPPLCYSGLVIHTTQCNLAWPLTLTPWGDDRLGDGILKWHYVVATLCRMQCLIRMVWQRLSSLCNSNSRLQYCAAELCHVPTPSHHLGSACTCHCVSTWVSVTVCLVWAPWPSCAALPAQRIP